MMFPTRFTALNLQTHLTYESYKQSLTLCKDKDFFDERGGAALILSDARSSSDARILQYRSGRREGRGRSSHRQQSRDARVSHPLACARGCPARAAALSR